MKDIIRFLTALSQHNDKKWFDAHRQQYLDAKAKFEEVTEQIIMGCEKFDSRIHDLTVKDCTYRIYRDVRFSSDKSPYKTHMGAYVCPGGKKSGYAGYYFHLGIGGEGYPHGHLLAAGDYRFQPEVLKVLREDIIADDGELDKIIKNKVSPLFALDKKGALKRVPQGFPPNSRWVEYLKLRTFCLCATPNTEFMIAEDVVERAIELFATTQPFIEYINRAIEYTKEELS